MRTKRAASRTMPPTKGEQAVSTASVDAASVSKGGPDAAPGAIDKAKALIDWGKSLFPVRVWTHYLTSRGPLLASGLSYGAVFATFAALWAGFSIAGLVLQSNDELRTAFFVLLNTSVPGLIDLGDGGLIDPALLLEATVLTWTGAIAVVGLLFTAVGWLMSARNAVRIIFGLPRPLTNFFLLKLKDFGLALAFGVALVVSSALLVFSTQALSVALDFLGIDPDSAFSATLGRVIGLALMFALDAVVLAALFRTLSDLLIPWRRLIWGSLLGAAGLGGLKVLGSALLGGVSSNPLLASFAVFLGLMIWFNLVCQVILVAASWIAVGMADAGIIADPKLEAKRLEDELRQAEQRARELEAAKAARRGHWWKRLFVRDKG